MLRRDRRRADDDLGAVRAQQVDLLLAHLVRHHEHAAVFPARGHDGKPDPCVPGRRLDDRPARLEQVGALRSVEHRDTDAILHAATGLEQLELRDQVAGQLAADAIQPYERRVADQIDQRSGDVHRRAGIAERTDVDAGRMQGCAIGNVVVRVHGDREPVAMERQGGLLGTGARDPDLARDARPKIGDHGGGHGRIGDPDDVVRAREQPFRRRALSQDHQDVHTLSLPGDSRLTAGRLRPRWSIASSGSRSDR